jgi:hypothetical protein
LAVKQSHFEHRAICISAAALLAGCGGSQPPIGAPGTTLASSANATHAKTSASGELLYASAASDVFVFTYPQGSLVETLAGFAFQPWYICADGRGDVFVPTTNLQSPGYIYEFAHGGTQPIEKLTDPGPGNAVSCSVDPTTGNLAVANGPNVAVYPQGQGAPTIYEASDVGAFDCAYDDSGDLFVDGLTYDDKIAELPAGGSSFSDVSLTKAMGYTLHLQWWNKRLVLFGGEYGPHTPYRIYQVRISGSSGIVSGPILLDGRNDAEVEFALSGDTFVMPDGPGDSLLYFWHYPKGGKRYMLIDPGLKYVDFYGVAISE